MDAVDMNREHQVKLRNMIAGSMWIGALTREERGRVEADTTAQLVLAGEYVLRKDDPTEYWNGVVDGLVKFATAHANGRNTTYTAVPNGGWFGEASLQRSAPRSYDAIALRDSLIAYMPRETFLWLLDHNIHFNHFIMRLLAERLFQFFSLLEYDRLLDSTSRVAHCLASLFNPWLHPGLGPQLDISQAEIGNLVGLSRQRVNMALKVLDETGLLRVEHHSITVLDVEGLGRYEDAGRARKHRVRGKTAGKKRKAA
jgi:CRP/FNR family cyclic AMP-dependent transcriptional regulator